LAHHGLSRLIIEESLHNLRILITWVTFRDIQTEDIKALTYVKVPTTS